LERGRTAWGTRAVSDKLRIFLADDHAVVREGLKTLINDQPDMEVVGEAADGVTAVEETVKLRPDIALLDLSMPGKSGIEATSLIRSRAPVVRVLNLTVHEDKSYIRQALDAGASGYVLKRAAATELIGAIRAVAGGGTYIDPALTFKLIPGVSRPGGDFASSVTLSEREEEVLRLMAQGYSNKEISARLDVSVKTVETYKARSFEKLGLKGRVELIQYALRCGWLQE
jgi:DNA-binding NarL/FixJ family response regulator